MYYYKPDNNRQGRRAGAIALACYLVVFLGVSFLVSFRMDYPAVDQGILVDFGESDGSGEENVMLSQSEETVAPRSSASQEEFMTQDYEQAPSVASGLHAERQPSRNDNSQMNNESDTPSREEQAHEVNRRALFPGRSIASQSVSQGDADSDGNSGHVSGADGVSSGTGIGTEGVSFSLSGRRPVGSLPRPSYDSDAQGKVVVEITVDAQGRVQTAAFQPLGSTTQDPKLTAAALRAARSARFTPSENNAVQTGTITYVFRLQ